MHYKQSEELLRLIKNKSVVLVGPAQYLMGKRIGSFINSFDTTCRVNYMAPSNLEEDYGNRADIMFYNCSALSLGQMKQHFEEYPDYSKKLKLTVCPVVKVLGPEKWKEWGTDFVSPVVKNYESINIHNHNFHWIGMENYRYLFDLIACQEPNTGLLAISIIMEHEPKEVFFTGFTFYENKHDTYFPNYATRDLKWTGVTGHPQQLQKNFFKNKILPQGIKIDSYLNDLLKLNHSNIYKL